MIDSKGQNYPIFFVDESYWDSLSIRYKYANITTMMITNAEFYESGDCYYYHENSRSQYLLYDKNKGQEIFDNYNSFIEVACRNINIEEFIYSQEPEETEIVEFTFKPELDENYNTRLEAATQSQQGDTPVDNSSKVLHLAHESSLAHRTYWSYRSY